MVHQYTHIREEGALSAERRDRRYRGPGMYIDPVLMVAVPTVNHCTSWYSMTPAWASLVFLSRPHL